jgi:hypothetical protein
VLYHSVISQQSLPNAPVVTEFSSYQELNLESETATVTQSIAWKWSPGSVVDFEKNEHRYAFTDGKWRAIYWQYILMTCLKFSFTIFWVHSPWLLLRATFQTFINSSMSYDVVLPLWLSQVLYICLLSSNFQSGHRFEQYDCSRWIREYAS